MQGEHSRRLTEAQIDKVAEEYRAGDPVHVIAARFGCSDAVIRNALKLRAVTMRIGGSHSSTTGRGYRYS